MLEKKKEESRMEFWVWRQGWREGSFREENLLKIHKQRQRPRREKIRENDLAEKMLKGL